jgi:hypothetical protein
LSRDRNPEIVEWTVRSEDSKEAVAGVYGRGKSTAATSDHGISVLLFGEVLWERLGCDKTYFSEHFLLKFDKNNFNFFR